ncbi:hypothetical protein BGZ59_003372 [Podila verticillata]|nr:hypothetical protein BGZ59_003372 [Podila verticillata]
MSSFMAMHYDSDSDSADDLDFQPASDVSSSSSSSDEAGSGPEDENMEEVVPEDKESSQAPSSVTAPTPEPKPIKTPKKKMSKKKASVANDVKDVKAQPKKRGRKHYIHDDNDPIFVKSTKAKSSKKAPKPTAALPTAIPSIHSPFGLPGAQIDMDHPLETFKWPYSPFTTEFKEQHRARDKLSQDLRLAVQEIKGTNTHATRRLQDLDNRLQLSRQDLSTCLDEIQFRKSQLRDMSLMAVDIVKKLSRQPASVSLASIASRPDGQSGTECDPNGSVIPNTTTTGMSHVDHMMMDVDQESSGDDQSGSSHSPTLKGLNEGNVRSFLEKIRELEQAQRSLA